MCGAICLLKTYNNVGLDRLSRWGIYGFRRWLKVGPSSVTYNSQQDYRFRRARRTKEPQPTGTSLFIVHKADSLQ